MKCYKPSSQLFDLKDKIITIDWGYETGDISIKSTARKLEDGTLHFTKIEVLEYKDLKLEWEEV